MATESVMENLTETIVIRDVDEPLVKDDTRPQRAPQPDHTYRQWENLLDDVPASVTENVATPSIRQRKRDTTNSFTPLIV